MKIQILLSILLFSLTCSIQAQKILNDDAKSQKFSQTYSWMIGTMSTDKYSKLGFTTGLAANYRFNTKIGLETGLQYARVKESYIKKDNLYLFSREPDTIYIVAAPEDFYLIQTWTLDYLKMPLLFTFQALQNVQFKVGGELNYVLGWSYDFSHSYEIDSGLPTWYELMYDGGWGSFFDGNVVASISYFPISNLGIDVLYRKGYRNSINTGIQLSLRYQIIPFK